MKINVISLSFIIYLNQCVSKNYNNYSLFRGIPVNEIHMEFFKTLGDKFDVNYWRYPGVINMPVDFVISPEEQPALLVEAERHGINLTTVIKDVQSAFDMQTVKPYTKGKVDSFDWFHYFRLEDMYQWLRDLKKAFPREMTLQVIGKTHERRDIMAVKIMHNRLRVRSKVFVEGGIHAREWISPAVVTCLMSRILHAGQSEDWGLKEIATTYEWYFVPVLNPDGFEYTHTTDRLWRKNRYNEYGVDLNRNFNDDFGTVGIVNRTSSELYCGARVFSEKESLALVAFLKTRFKHLDHYISFHSYGQCLILPCGQTANLIKNFNEMKEMCNEAATQIATRFNTNYTVGTTYETMGYSTSGTSTCWVKKVFKVPYVLTVELRDDGKYGFALPPVQIMPTCQETMDGLLSLLTRRTTKYPKHIRKYNQSGQKHLLDKIVLVWNVLLFIIVRFDLSYVLNC